MKLPDTPHKKDLSDEQKNAWEKMRSLILRDVEAEPVWAVSMIEVALQQGWKVEVAYNIYRNLELAFYGAIQRAEEEGRAVPLEKMAKNHREVQRSIIKLSEVFLGRKGISFLYIHNLGKKGALADPLKIKLKELEYNGALHYLERHEHYYAEAAKHLCKDDDA